MPTPPYTGKACNSLHLIFVGGFQKIVAYSHFFLSGPSCITSFWHGVIPTSYFIFHLSFSTRDSKMASYITETSRTCNVAFSKILLASKECGNECVWQLMGALNVSPISRRQRMCENSKSTGG